LLERHRVETAELGPLAKLPPFAPVVISLLRLCDREGSRGAITSPALAIGLLGTEHTKSLATTLALRSMMKGAPRTAVVRRLWIHSVATAAIAQEFAAAFEVPKNLAHIAGILHDLGRMGLLAAHPAEYTRLALAARNTEADIRFPWFT